MTRSTWSHLRFPFSFYLLPVYVFALSQTPSVNWGRALLVFVILHLLVYPASNGFNSYYDRDQESIGGLEQPPTVTADLLYVSLAMDALALALGLCLGWRFVSMLFVAGLVSKAYSHPAIRLKAAPSIGWLSVALFQGGFAYLMIVVAIVDPGQTSLSSKVLVPALISSLLFGGAYPMTQIYQHAEDARRGDRTLSLVLGVKGTFAFSGVFLGLSVLAFYRYFGSVGRPHQFYLLLAFLTPITAYWMKWLVRVLRDERQADFHSAMTLSRVSATALTCLFSMLTLC